jgi:cellulose synthase/poly-beta-1,6-N-acetylglucosamine synthase-like glycosyltransferase
MRIAVIYDFVANLGGGDFVMLNILEALHDVGYKVTLLTSYPEGLQFSARFFGKTIPNVNIYSVKVPRFLKHPYSIAYIVVITEADSRWASHRTLSNAVAWLSDPTVGAVTCVKNSERGGFLGVEGSYRGFYNTVRLAESKVWSTPVFHGELAAYRRGLLEAVGGFPTDIGADDSHTATLVALRGYRAVAVDDVECIEKVPEEGYHAWRVRRAQHLVQHFLKTLRHVGRAPSRFKPVLLVKAYLHLVNPWLLPMATTLLIHQALKGSIIAIAVLVAGTLLLAYKPYRTWVATQLYLITAMLKNLLTKDIAWEKQVKG